MRFTLKRLLAAIALLAALAARGPFAFPQWQSELDSAGFFVGATLGCLVGGFRGAVITGALGLVLGVYAASALGQ